MARRSVSDDHILYAILAETRDAGAPSSRAVAKHLGMSPSALHRRIAKLEELGVITTDGGLRLTEEAVIFLTTPRYGTVTLRYVTGPTGITVLPDDPF